MRLGPAFSERRDAKLNFILPLVLILLLTLGCRVRSRIRIRTRGRFVYSGSQHGACWSTHHVVRLSASHTVGVACSIVASFCVMPLLAQVHLRSHAASCCDSASPQV